MDIILKKISEIKELIKNLEKKKSGQKKKSKQKKTQKKIENAKDELAKLKKQKKEQKKEQKKIQNELEKSRKQNSLRLAENKKAQALDIVMRRIKAERRTETLRRELINFLQRNEYPIPDNIDDLSVIEMRELGNRVAEINNPRKTIPKEQRVNHDVPIGNYVNPFGEIAINTNAGFIYQTNSENRIRSFIERTYDNEDNMLVINLFIALRYYLIQYREIAETITARLFISYYDSIRKEQIDDEYNLSHKNVFALMDAKNAADINNIIRTMDEHGQGSDTEVNTPLINPRIFIIGYLPKNVEGKGFTYKPTITRKDLHVYRKEGFICIDPPNDGDNCLIECFRAVTNSNKTSKTIRQLFNWGASGALALSHIPKLETYFKKKVVVITGRDEEGKLNILYPEDKKNMTSEELEKADWCDFGIMYYNNHFALIKVDEIILKAIIKEEQKKRKENRIELDNFIKTKQGEKAAELTKIGWRKKEEFKQLVNEGKIEEAIKFVIMPKASKYRYLFFDFETVYNNQGALRPYALSAILYDDEFNEIERYFCAEEVGKNAYKIRESFAKFLNKYNDFNFINLMISYNGARFDNFLLGEILGKMKMLKGNNLQMANGQILKMKFKSYTVIDLCKFVMLPLKVACEGFKCNDNKLDFDHNIVQKTQFEGKLHIWLKENMNTLREYNDRDNIVLQQLFRKVKESIIQLTGQQIEDFMTISQMTYDHWRKDCPVSKLPPPLEENVQFMRKAIVAGRSQAFRKGFFDVEKLGGGLLSLDVKSLYPFVMAVCKFPIGQEIKTEKYVEGKLGIYNVHIISQPKTKIIPQREKGKPLNWEYDKEFDCILTSVDIDTLKDYGAEYIIKDGYYWEESDNVFEKYVEPLKKAKTQEDIWKEEKNERYNPALREIIKLYLNSLSGKVGQREYIKNVEFCFTENQIRSFLKKHKDVIYTEIPKMNCVKLEGLNENYKYTNKKAKPFHLAAFIYSYARSHMYRSILSKVDDKFFTDTDSCHILKSSFNKLVDEGKFPAEEKFGKFHMGGEFGDFENEIPFDVKRYYAIAPKCYAIIGDTKSKFRFKGINQRCDKILQEVDMGKEKDYRKNDVQLFNKKTMFEKFNAYQELPIACAEPLYKSLTNGKCVAILSSHIRRVTGSKKMSSLHQNFLIKTIAPTGEVNN